MKAVINFLLLAILTFSLALASCKKDENTGEQAMTEEEAVETAEAIVANTATDLEEVAKVADDYSTDSDTTPSSYCGSTFDTTWTTAYTTSTGAGSYTSTWGFKVNCNGLVPVSMDLTADADGSYESILISGTETGDGDYTIEGLLSSAANYKTGGSYTVESSVTSKKGLLNTYAVETDLVLTDVLVNKSSLIIQSGSGTMSLTAISPKGVSATFTGTFVFNGNGTLTLTINGKSYTIDY